MIKVWDYSLFDSILCFLCIELTLLQHSNFRAFSGWDEQTPFHQALLSHVINPTRALLVDINEQ
jgi:hypothetical protein